MSSAQLEWPSDDRDDHSLAGLMHRLLPCESITFVSVDPVTRCGYFHSWSGALISQLGPAPRRRGDQTSPHGFTSGCCGPGSRCRQPGAAEHPVLGWLRRHPRACDPLRLTAAEASVGDDAGLPARHTLLLVPLSTKPPWLAAWLLARSSEEFGPAELDVARLIAPGLRQRWRLGRLRAESVTGRELEVLQLVSNGLTATAVGRRCGISTRTVHKHLENAYDKLGCHDRLTAVLILQDAGLLGQRAEQPA